jgi:curli biogenesis system outer membrane secretion channel CsgG
MRRSKTVIVCLFALAFLSACQSTYSKTLDEKLAGKTQSEKRTILAEECRNEIQRGLNPKNPDNVRHFESKREICEELTGKKITLTK